MHYILISACYVQNAVQTFYITATE